MQGMTHVCAVGSRTAQEKEPDGRIEGRRLRGLSWNKTHQLWRVRIYFNGKLRFVGRFEDAITAARAYDKAAVYLYGASAITNFGIEACLADETEVGACIIRAKDEAEQQAAARQAACGGGGGGSSSNSSTPGRQQQQHSDMSHLWQSPQQTSPNAASTATSLQSSHTNVPSPSSDSSRYSMSTLDAMLLLSGGCGEPAAAATGSPLTLAAAAAMAGVAGFNAFDSSSSSSKLVDATLLHQISGMSAESTAGACTPPSLPAAALAGGASTGMSVSSSSAFGSFHMPHPTQYALSQTHTNLCNRSASLPGLGLTSVGENNSLAAGVPDATQISAQLAQLLITTPQQQQQQQWLQQQQQQQSLAFLSPQLQFAGLRSPGKNWQQSCAPNVAWAGSMFSGAPRQVSMTADCRAAATAAPTAAAAAVGLPPGLSTYNQQLLLQQQALLRQQLLQQQLHELAVQEAMLSASAAAAAAAAAEAFPACAGRTAVGSTTLSLGGACNGLFGNQHACFVPALSGHGSPPTLYTSTGSSGSLSSRWSMPL